MRAALTMASVLCLSGANALAGAMLVGELSTTLIGQYIAVIVFLSGVAGVLAKIVQALYQRMLADKDKRIAYLEAQISELRNEREQQ